MKNKTTINIFVSIIIFLFSKNIYANDLGIPKDSYDRIVNLLTATRDRLYEQNDRIWHAGEHARNIIVLRLITELDPTDVDAYDNAAWLLQSDLRDDEAEILLIKSSEINNSEPDPFFYLGYFYYMHERFEEALTNLEIANSYQNIPPFYRSLLAHAYELAGYNYTALSIWCLIKLNDPSNTLADAHITRIITGGKPSNIPKIMGESRAYRRELKEKGLPY
ncbi:MAG: hypothetical protein SNJ70_06375 [Armatimonadota bacterium]